MFFPKKSREEDVNKAQTPNLPYPITCTVMGSWQLACRWRLERMQERTASASTIAGFILLWESLPNRTAAERSGATAGRCAVPDRVWAGAKRAAGWPWPGLQQPLLRRRASGRPLVMHAGFQSGHGALLLFPTIHPIAAATPQPRAGIRRRSALFPFPAFFSFLYLKK